MEPARPQCLSASARTPLGVVTPEPASSELLLSGSNCPESLSNAESCCQTNAHRLGLRHSTSQVESCERQQPGYLLCHTGLLLPLNCSVMKSFFCHYLHHCLHPMRAAIKIKPQGKGPARLTINQSMSCLHYPLNSYHPSLNTCSHWLDSRCPSPPQIRLLLRLVKNVEVGMMFGYLMFCEWDPGSGMGGHPDISPHQSHCHTLEHISLSSREVLPDDNIH